MPALNVLLCITGNDVNASQALLDDQKVNDQQPVDESKSFVCCPMESVIPVILLSRGCFFIMAFFVLNFNGFASKIRHFFAEILTRQERFNVRLLNSWFLEIKLDNGAAQRESIAKDNEVETGKKERSVLQAKLTRLAIQIGYAGSFVAGCTVLILVIRFV